jgi:hypothetical protein
MSKANRLVTEAKFQYKARRNANRENQSNVPQPKNAKRNCMDRVRSKALFRLLFATN